MRVETTTNNRKAMAYALAERLGAECRYMGTPTYAYRVGNLTIERDGAITGEHLDLLAVTGWLLEHVGYHTLFPYAAAMTGAAFFTMLFVRHGDSRPEAAKSVLEHFDAAD